MDGRPNRRKRKLRFKFLQRSMDLMPNQNNRSFSLSRSKKINRKPFSGLSQEIVNLLKINKEDTSPSFTSVRSPKL